MNAAGIVKGIASVTTFHRHEKAHLKLSRKSVGQGRGGLERTVRPSPLRAGSPPCKRILKKKIKSSRETKPARMTRTTGKTRTSDKTYPQETKQKLKSLAKKTFKNQTSLKIKTQKHWSRK